MRTISRLLLALLLALALIAPAQAADKIKVLLIDGQNNHAWAKTTPVIKANLEKTGRFTVDVVTSPAKPQAPKAVKGGKKQAAPKSDPAAWAAFKPEFAKYDVVFSNYNGEDWPAEAQKNLEQYMANGGGLVIFHAANNAFSKWVEWNKMIGLNWMPNTFGDGIKIVDGKMVRIPKGEGNGAGHGPQHPYTCELVIKDHPITAGMPAKWTHVSDELYHGQRGPALNMTVLVSAFDDPAATQGKGTGNNEPMVYTVSYGKGRVFVDLLGHDVPQTQAPDNQALLARGTEWAATGKVTLPIPEDFKGQ